MFSHAYEIWYVIGGILGYCILGTIWATFKWRLLCGHQREKYDEAKETFLGSLSHVAKVYDKMAKNNASSITDKIKSASLEDNSDQEKFKEFARICREAPNNLKELTDELKPVWTHWCRDTYSVEQCARSCPGSFNVLVPSDIGTPPQMKFFKARIFTWIGYWPFSVAFFLCNDPFHWFAKWAYKRMGIIFASIGKSVFRGVDDDFVEEETVVIEETE